VRQKGRGPVLVSRAAAIFATQHDRAEYARVGSIGHAATLRGGRVRATGVTCCRRRYPLIARRAKDAEAVRDRGDAIPSSLSSEL